jgi:hypothetical protein
MLKVLQTPLTSNSLCFIMNIINQQDSFCKELIGDVPKRLHRMFRFAFFSYSLETVSSMRGNARRFVKNAYTAKSKAWRCLKNKNLRDLLPRFLPTLCIVSKKSIVAIDFSSFGPWQVLMFAVETRKGRALPVFFKIITYPIERDSQNIFIIKAIEEFAGLVKERPKLVFDRGFACPYIIKKLAQQKHLFYIRIKGGKHMKVEDDKVYQARDVPKDDLHVIAYELNLRLIKSDDPGNGNEPWFIITNDKNSTRREIINYYYFRFEIEEFFKDAKWLQGLEWVHFRKIESMTTLLWLILIGWWCMSTIIPNLPIFDISSPKAKACLSQFRHFFESLSRAKNFLLLKELGYDSV